MLHLLYYITCTYHIYLLKFYTLVHLLPDFFILSHCHCWYKNVFIMEFLFSRLVSAMPSLLFITLLFHGIYGYSCLFVVLSNGLCKQLVHTQENNTDNVHVVNDLNLIIRENWQLIMLSILTQVHSMSFHLFKFVPFRKVI